MKTTPRPPVRPWDGPRSGRIRRLRNTRPRRQVHQAGDDRLVRLGLESAQLLGHDVAGGDAAARAVDPEQDRGDLGIAGRGIELVAEGRERIVADGIEAAIILVQENAVDVDQGDPGTGRGSVPARTTLAVISPGSTAEGSLTSNGAPDVGVGHDPGITPKRRGDREDMAAAGEPQRRETGQYLKEERTRQSEPPATW